MDFNNYGNNSGQQSRFSGQPQPQHFSQIPQTITSQQNVQPLFPQPQGNVYNIGSTLEIANVPASAGISVALCLNEGMMCIKSIQNGNPLLWFYKIAPYDGVQKPSEESESATSDYSDKFESYNKRFENLESQMEEILKTLKKKNSNKGEWDI